MSNQIFLKEIDEVLVNEVSCRHSYFQLKYFLIGKEPTNQAKMWQCLRELKTRKDSLDNIVLEEEELKDNLELLNINIEELNERNSDAKTTIQIRQIERKKLAINNNFLALAEKKKWLEEECRFFLETFKNIQKIEPLKQFDDLSSQKEYWAEKLSQKLNLKMLTSNNLDGELIETIMALPDDMPIKKQTITTLNIRQEQMIQNMKKTLNKIEGSNE